MTAAGQHYFTVSEAAEPTWIALSGLAAVAENAGEISHCRTYLEGRAGAEAEWSLPEPAIIFQDNKESAKSAWSKSLPRPLLLDGSSDWPSRCSGSINRLAYFDGDSGLCSLTGAANPHLSNRSIFSQVFEITISP